MKEIDINDYFIMQDKIQRQITVVANFCRKKEGRQ